MSKKLQPNPQKAIEWLLWLSAGEKIYLEHISSQGAARPKGKFYQGNEATSAARFVAANNGDELQRNLHFVPNGEFLEGKRVKANLKAVRFLHADLDCKDYPGTEVEQDNLILGLLHEQKKRPKGIPHPTAIWFTGGGYQALWRLSEPLDIDTAEELNRSILIAFQGGEGTHDAGRLLRLPFTTNWLNDKKRAAGREPTLSYPLDPPNTNSPPVSFSTADFTISRAKRGPSASAGTSPTHVAVPEFEALPLPENLCDVVPTDPVWSEVIISGKNPPDKNYGSRSELVFASVLWLLGKDVEPGHVLSIITHPDLGISGHVLDNPNPLKYGRRQVERGLAVLELSRGGWPVVNEESFPVSNLPENIRYAFGQIGVDAQRNRFTQADEVTGYQLDGRDLNEIADILCSVFSRELKFMAGPAAIKRELLAIAHEHPYHPVIDYLDGLEWDGTLRIDHWLANYCNAEDTELNGEFGSKLLVAGVRRIKQPGVKFDTMLVLEGSQGAGKSQMAALLAVRNEWFCGSLDLKSDDKTKAEMLARAWIVECQELDGLNKTTSQNLKKFLSTPTDTYRRAYGRDANEYRRHCIILGTTNEVAYLRDLTGNRRIWPVEVAEIALDRIASDVNQLWAEAVVREKAGGSIVLSEHLWDAAKELQTDRMIEDDFVAVLTDFLEGRVGKISMDSLKLILGLQSTRRSHNDFRRIKTAMENIGWEYGTFRLHDANSKDKRPRKGFARGDEIQRRREEIAGNGSSGVSLYVLHESGTKTPF